MADERIPDEELVRPPRIGTGAIRLVDDRPIQATVRFDQAPGQARPTQSAFHGCCGTPSRASAIASLALAQLDTLVSAPNSANGHLVQDGAEVNDVLLGPPKPTPEAQKPLSRPD